MDQDSKTGRKPKQTMMARGPLPPPVPNGAPPSVRPAATSSRPAAPTPPLAAPAAPAPPVAAAVPVPPIAAAVPVPSVPAAAPSRAPDPVAPSSSSRNTTYRAPPQNATTPVPNRENQVGSHLAGAEGLAEAGSDAPRIRLQAGKPVPGTRYTLRRWLGEGGMGVVYEAEHMDIERRVALKILRFDLSQQAHMAQVFRDEARAASRIGSEYIVEIFDFGELPDGRLWFCMELLNGTDLVPEEENESMDPARLIGLLRMTCKGLDRAHEQGIVHRDIKPENILTVTDDRREVVKIVDFGISAMLAAGQQGGSVAGTPHYMPPEQVLGQPFDGRCDMYALGATAYELLAGQPPFVSEDLQELLDMQVNSEPPPLASRRTDVQIPAALADVVMKCLAKDPEDRYRDMRDLEAALCEAQITLGYQTPWDDLPLPEVDEERRNFLLTNMPNPVLGVQQQKRRWLWPAVAAASALLAGGAILFALNNKPTENELAQIETLTQDARHAGSTANWVYPAYNPNGEAKGMTSFVKVLELEDLEGNLDGPGDERAQELRMEFSKTLMGFGEQFWDLDATKSIARDYYLQAWMFDQDNELAYERAGATPGMAATQLRKAEAMAFTEAETRAGRQQAFLAMASKGEAFPEGEAEDLFAEQDGMSVQGRQFRKAARAKGITMPKGADVSDLIGGDADSGSGEGAGEDGGELELDGGEDGTDGGGDEGETGDDPNALVLEEIAGDRPRIGSGRGRGKKKKVRGSEDAGLGKGERDPARAAELADQGQAALRAGKRSEASKLFNQAISFDNRSAKALMGLSDVYFDTGHSQKAVVYAERAVRAASKNSSYRLKLGDAYYRVLRYKDALEQYEKAKSMGSSKAASRISKVQAKIG